MFPEVIRNGSAREGKHNGTQYGYRNWPGLTRGNEIQK